MAAVDTFYGLKALGREPIEIAVRDRTIAESILYIFGRCRKLTDKFT